MEIKRYTLKDKEQGDAFGDHFRQHTYDFDWFIGDKNIGIRGTPSTEAEAFIGGFLVTNDTLTISQRSDQHSYISRRETKYAYMNGSEAPEEVSLLITMIRNNEQVHAFQASVNEGGEWPRILTFSTQPPSPEHYEELSTMLVEQVN